MKNTIKRLSKRKYRERKFGAGRHFKLDVRNRFLMLLVYYRLYITYTLIGFLLDLDQSNVCRDIQKIERLIRKCVLIPQKTYNITKRLQTPQKKSNNIFQAFCLSQIPPNNRYNQDLKIRGDARCTIQERRKDILSRISLWLTIVVISFTN